MNFKTNLILRIDNCTITNNRRNVANEREIVREKNSLTTVEWSSDVMDRLQVSDKRMDIADYNSHVEYVTILDSFPWLSRSYEMSVMIDIK